MLKVFMIYMISIFTATVSKKLKPPNAYNSLYWRVSFRISLDKIWLTFLTAKGEFDYL